MAATVASADVCTAALRMQNNPQGEPTGHFTGRCGCCGSTDLWDDNSAYGCNTCGEFWIGVEPRLVPNGNAILPKCAKAWQPLPAVPALDLDAQEAKARAAIARTIKYEADRALWLHREESRDIEARLDRALDRHRADFVYALNFLTWPGLHKLHTGGPVPITLSLDWGRP